MWEHWSGVWNRWEMRGQDSTTVVLGVCFTNMCNNVVPFKYYYSLFWIIHTFPAFKVIGLFLALGNFTIVLSLTVVFVINLIKHGSSLRLLDQTMTFRNYKYRSNCYIWYNNTSHIIMVWVWVLRNSIQTELWVFQLLTLLYPGVYFN